MSSLTPDQAREQLKETAERAGQARTDARIGALFTAGLAVLIAATLASVTIWRGNPVGVSVSTAVCALAFVALMGWYRSRFRVSDRLWPQRYLIGFGLTIALYCAGIMWQAVAFPGWAVFAPYCLLVAGPGIVAAIRMLRR